MAGMSSPPSGSARMKFYLFSITVMFILGFVGGVSATKRAITAPDWVQRMFGLHLPPPQQVAVATPQTTAPPTNPAPSTPAEPVNPSSNPPANHQPTASTPKTDDPDATASKPTGDAQGFVGRWEITDEIQAGDGTPTKILSGYVFNADGTGEFNTNGKKMYDLRWNLAGDYLTVTYDNPQAPAGDDGAIRMRWSVTPDKTLLTLVPENSKDARESLYSVGHGVYHKK